MPPTAGTSSDLDGDLEAAIAIHRQGRVDEAESTYRQILQMEPDHPEALHMMGVVHLQKQRLEDALTHFQAAIAGNGTDARYHNNAGNALSGLKRWDEAIAEFEQALALDPQLHLARCNLAYALTETGRDAAAVAAYEAVLEADPGNRTALNNIGALLMLQSRYPEAERHLRHALEVHGENAGLLSNLANTLERLNRWEEADSLAQRALQADPEAVEPRLLRARLHKRAGRLEEARLELTKLLQQPITQRQGATAHFELGQVLDRLGDYEEAAAAFTAANAPDARTMEDEGARYLSWVALNRRTFAGGRLSPPALGRDDRNRRPPVFFVGFPRSGTTLMETMLAAHPEIVTTQEVSPLSAAIRRHRVAGGDLATIRIPGAAELEEDRRTFWQEADRVFGAIEGQCLVDKSPLNIVNLGLANLVFPSSPVIVALRDPRDVCLSCFMQQFKMTDALRNFTVLETTVRTYAAVMDLWLQYRDVLTMPWMEYRYEDLVEDVEGTVRQVLSFIGLDWHPEIDRYREHSMKSVPKTPSYRDVTSPVSSRSVGRWRSYRMLIDPHLDTLQPYVEEFGYPTD